MQGSSNRLKLRSSSDIHFTSSLNIGSSHSISSSKTNLISLHSHKSSDSDSDRNHGIESSERSPASSTLSSHANALKVLNAVMISASFLFGDISHAAVNYDTPSPAASMPLETAIVNLEQASSRTDVVQALADLYESSGTKTLLARSKYKYVSSPRSCPCDTEMISTLPYLNCRE
jgi:hypothetical protein